MVETSIVDLDTLRARLTDEHRGILDGVWESFRDQNHWILRRVLHHRFGKPAVRACLEQLGDSIIREVEDDGKECYRLTFLGVLLTSQGEEAEQLLAGYLEFIRSRHKTNPSLEWVGSQDVEAALSLSQKRSRLLRQLIRLSHWWGGGSGFGDQEWTVGVPVDVDDLPTQADLQGYVREHVLRHFPQGAPAGEAEKPRGEFWFIDDLALRRQLALDWHEAQDAYQVQGWKSCVVLSGGILEAVLLDAMGRDAKHARLELADLVEAARHRGILGTGTPLLGPALRGFRHLIHPGRPMTERIHATKDEAEAALIAVRMCLRQMGAHS